MKKKLLIAILALQTVWVCAVSLVQESKLASPTVVTLKTVPVDPRDLFKGDYVVLRYEISTLPASLFKDAMPDVSEAGRKVYVVLEPSGECYHAVAAWTREPSLSPGQVLIQGAVEAQRPWMTSRAMELRVEYGLEKYFVKEGTGTVRGQTTVKVALTRHGNPAIREVLVDGVPYAEAARKLNLR